jgi:5-bromo-4-chloroindolyl phosphate hydrolysis protein
LETGISCRILAPEFKPKQFKMSEYTLKRQVRYYKRQLEQNRKRIKELEEQMKQKESN